PTAIARAFLVSEPTIAQRLVRAKRTIRDRALPYEVPEGEELEARLPAALAVLYLIFNEGYAAHTGEALVRHDLCEEAIRLGGMLVELMPQEPEVRGLLALMELQASRETARTDAQGNLVLLADQDRGHWDHARIARGLALLERADSLASAGPYQLQATIAACHAREYHLLPAARADFLRRLGRRAEAASEYRRALGLADNAREQAFYERRLAACDDGVADRER